MLWLRLCGMYNGRNEVHNKHSQTHCRRKRSAFRIKLPLNLYAMHMCIASLFRMNIDASVVVFFSVSFSVLTLFFCKYYDCCFIFVCASKQPKRICVLRAENEIIFYFFFLLLLLFNELLFRWESVSFCFRQVLGINDMDWTDLWNSRENYKNLQYYRHTTHS